MLSNDDLAELLESTRDRIIHMSEGSASGLGTVRVLDGLIALLREQAPAAMEESAAATESEFVAQDPAAPEPEPRKRVPVRFRTAQPATSAAPKENPLLRPQYADFFNKLIASHKTDAPSAEETDEASQAAPDETAAPAQTTVNPRYQGFFDALIGKQKAPDSKPAGEAFRDETATG